MRKSNDYVRIRRCSGTVSDSLTFHVDRPHLSLGGLDGKEGILLGAIRNRMIPSGDCKAIGRHDYTERAENRNMLNAPKSNKN